MLLPGYISKIEKSRENFGMENFGLQKKEVKLQLSDDKKWPNGVRATSVAHEYE